MTMSEDPSVRYLAVFDQKWYPVVNDLIGGWAASNVDKPLSQQDHSVGREDGQWCIAEFMDEQTARYIVDLHNRSKSFLT